MDAFTQNCKYYQSVQNLESMKAGGAKIKLQNSLKACFKKEWPSLELAENLLIKAAILEEQNPEKGRGKLIESNKSFIGFVKNFIQ
jgi:hypothetical protein